MPTEQSNLTISRPSAQATPQAPPGGPNKNKALWSTNHITAPYGTYVFSTSYIFNNGVIQGPIMATGQVKCKAISYAAPFSVKEVAWSATRSGMPPYLPHPTPTDSNMVLLNYTLSPMSCLIQEDGVTRDFSCSGVYNYILTTPIDINNAAYRWGSPDFDTTPPDLNVIRSFQFVKNIF